MGIDRQASTIDGNTPVWVNENLFEDLLREEVEDFHKILKFSTKQVQNLKENYFSIKTVIETKDNKKHAMSFVLKTSSGKKEEKLLPFLKAGNLKIENFVIFEIIPTLENLYKNKAIAKKLAPMAFKFPQTINEEYGLFEDLQCKSYKRVQQDAKGLNTKQMTMALEKLAAFHAASVVTKQFNSLPVIPKAATNELQTLTNRIFHEHLRSYNLRNYEDSIKSLQTYFHNRHSLGNFQDFNVLLLGNCCLDNMMFQYDAFGNAKDMIFINFESCSYGSPSKDLQYLLLSSSHDSDKWEKFEFYVKYYYDQLLQNLKLLNFEGQLPKLTDLHYDLIRNRHWAFEAVTQVLPFVLWQTATAGDQSTDALLKDMFEEHNYREQIEKLIPWLENKAFLEE